MGLKAIVDTLEGIPEALHEFYEEGEDGKFTLSLDEAEFREHPRAKGLRSALKRQQDDNKSLKERLATVEARVQGLPEDFDAGTYEELKAAAEGSKGGKSVTEAANRAREDERRKSEARVAEEKAKADKFEAALRRKTVDEGLTAALVAAKVGSEYLPAARALLRERGKIEMVERDNAFDAVVKDDLGVEKPLRDYVAEWASSDEGKAYIPKAIGADAKGGTGSNFRKNPWDPKTRNLTEQQRILQENPTLARQMAAAHGQTIPGQAA